MIVSHNLIVSVLVTIFSPISHGWNYKEQENWPEQCQKAIAQSPIDFKKSDMKKLEMGRLLFRNWNERYNATMINNGHTVLVELASEEPILVTGGGLPGVYQFAQFHFHWGSEHTLNGKRKALESHFVTYNTQYDSITEALKYRNGIAVLGVLYEQSARQNDKLKPIVNNIKSIQKAKQRTTIEINPINLLPRDLTQFWRYYGSLTTPDCNDVVVWTVFSRLVPISGEQAEEFASIRDGEGKRLSGNFRSVQPLNGRTVYVISTDDRCCDD